MTCEKLLWYKRFFNFLYIWYNLNNIYYIEIVKNPRVDVIDRYLIGCAIKYYNYWNSGHIYQSYKFFLIIIESAVF